MKPLRGIFFLLFLAWSGAGSHANALHSKSYPYGVATDTMILRIQDIETKLSEIRAIQRTADLKQGRMIDSLIKEVLTMKQQIYSLQESDNYLTKMQAARDTVFQSKFDQMAIDSKKSEKRDISLMLFMFILLTMSFSFILYRSYLLERQLTSAVVKEEKRIDKRFRLFAKQLRKKLHIKAFKVKLAKPSGKTNGF